MKNQQNKPFRLQGMLLFLGLSGALAYNVIASASDSMADPTNKELTNLGVKVYTKQCASCHGENLEGEPNWSTRKSDGKLPAPPHDPSGHTWHHSDDLLFKLTKFGIAAIAGPDYPTDMPAYIDVLSDKEIWAVLAYIKSTWPERIIEAQIRASH